MEIQVLRKKSKDDSKEIAKLKYENEDLQCCLMSSMEDNDSLKKQIKELKKKQCASSNLESKESISSSIVNEDNLKIIKDLKASVQELNTKLLEVDNSSVALEESNKSLFEKINLLKDEVKRQKGRASKAEFEVESFQRCKYNLEQQIQSLKYQRDNSSNNVTNTSNRPYQEFGSPNVRKIILFYFD